MTQIFFASNRNVVAETSATGAVFGDRFNADGPQCFRVGMTEVALKGDPLDDNAWSVGATRLYKEKLDDTMPKGARLGSSKLFDDLPALLRKEVVDVVIYLHGFANDFQNSAIRAAALSFSARPSRLTAAAVVVAVAIVRAIEGGRQVRRSP